MTALTLVIANRNYSSWSLRPWLAMTELGIPFTERMVKFDSDDWQRNIGRLSPTRLVPVLWEGEPGKGFATFDTIAILERLYELFPTAGIWPKDAYARSRARSLVAEFHSGYSAVRNAMPMNIRSSLPGRGASAEVKAEVDRLCSRWRDTREAFAMPGAFLFGDFTAADAFFAPVASRFATYAVPLAPDSLAYQQALLGTAGMRKWSAAARQETEFVPMDEPYQSPPA